MLRLFCSLSFLLHLVQPQAVSNQPHNDKSLTTHCKEKFGRPAARTSISDDKGDQFFYAIASHCSYLFSKPVVFDVGVNKGFTLLRYFFRWGDLADDMLTAYYKEQKIALAPKKVAKNLRVFGFDPLPSVQETVVMLEKKYAPHTLIFSPIALANKTGEEVFSVPYDGKFDEGGTLGDSRAKWSSKSYTLKVQVDTIDSVINTRGLQDESISFLKIDAEGMDFEVLAGAKNAFARKKIAAGYFECHSHTPLKAAVAFLNSFGYSTFLLQNDDRVVRLDGDLFPQGWKCDVNNIAFFRADLKCAAHAMCSYVGPLVPCDCITYHGNKL